jgi:hypothetical protein
MYTRKFCPQRIATVMVGTEHEGDEEEQRNLLPLSPFLSESTPSF